MSDASANCRRCRHWSWSEPRAAACPWSCSSVSPGDRLTSRSPGSRSASPSYTWSSRRRRLANNKNNTRAHTPLSLCSQTLRGDAITHTRRFLQFRDVDLRLSVPKVAARSSRLEMLFPTVTHLGMMPSTSKCRNVTVTRSLGRMTRT